jgi:hypothetical protein
VRDGRWRWSQVESWLRGDQPVDRYDLPRNTRLIRRGEHALTLTELADLYAQPVHFTEGVGQLFPEEGAKESVWQILQETPQFRAELDRVRPLREMTTMPPWQGQPEAMCQAAVAGLIWLTLAAPGQRRPLCFGDYVLTVAGLRRMFRERAALAESALVVLTAEPYLQRVGPLDPVARKALESLARAGREVVALAKSHGWTFLTPPAGQARLLEWVLASDAELQARCEGLRTRYAASSDARLDAWLRAAPTRVEQALLAASGDNPESHGFVTHEEWSRRRHAELIARATTVSQALLWRRLERLIVFTPALLGFWPLAAAIWLLPLVLLSLTHSWPLAGLTVLAAVVSRVAGTLATRRLVTRHVPGAATWRWTDHAPRCRREARLLLPGEDQVSIARLDAELGRIRHELARLPLPEGLAHAPASPRLGVLWGRAVVAMATPLVLLMFVVAPHYVFSGPSASRHAAVATPAAPASEKPTLIEETGPDGKVALFEIVQDGFGGRRRGPLKPWDIPKPAAPVPLQVVDQTVASGAQSAFAVVSAELLLAPYPRQGRNVLVAVAVPRAKGTRPAILLYDSATSRLADGWSYRVGSDLEPATWYKLTGRDVVYLGLPSALEGDDLIPLP